MMINRPRRMRNNAAIRSLVRETIVNVNDLVYPLFVVEGENVKKEISTMPDNYHFSVDRLEEEVKELLDLGIKAVILFGVPDAKDEIGSEAYNDNGIVQRSIREIKDKCPEMYVITDVCMCQFTSHGHCGILDEDGTVENDTTNGYLSKISVSHAEAGADMIAPSDMMDGRVSAIRAGLDANGFDNIPIMSYSVKYASLFYGPFRAAADSKPTFGDRKTYQMDPANIDEALREADLDIAEGADIIMVKPALSYLDIIRRVKDNFNVTVAAYNVSGEYSMIVNGIKDGLFDEKIYLEVLTSIKRAGADIIITYFAKKFAKDLKDGNI